MRRHTKWAAHAIVTLALSTSATVIAQSRLPSAPHTQKKSAESGATQQDVNGLRSLVNAQHQQLEELKAQFQQLLLATQQANAADQGAQSTADAARASLAEGGGHDLSGAVDGLKHEVAGDAQALLATRKSVEDLEHPTALRYKGITLTPGGFVTGDLLVRTRNENADVTSNFGALPFGGVANPSMKRASSSIL